MVEITLFLISGISDLQLLHDTNDANLQPLLSFSISFKLYWNVNLMMLSTLSFYNHLKVVITGVQLCCIHNMSNRYEATAECTIRTLTFLLYCKIKVIPLLFQMWEQTLCLLKHKRKWNQPGCRLQSFITFKKLANDYIQAVAKFSVSRFRETLRWKKSEAICLQFSGNLQCKQMLHVENRGFNTNDAVVFSIRQKLQSVEIYA